MRAHVYAMVLLCLAGCSQNDEPVDYECGPNKACPQGFSCDSVDRRCVTQAVMNQPDAGEPDASEPDAPVPEPDAAEPDAQIVYDAPPPPPDAAPPDAQIVYDAALPDAAPDASPPDASPPDAAPPDAEWVALHVSVVYMNEPVAGTDVITHDPTGTRLRTELTTGSSGRVKVMAEPGSWVSARWGNNSWTTVIGVEEGDELVLGSRAVPLPMSQTAGTNITMPVGYDGAEDYEVAVRDSALGSYSACRARTTNDVPITQDITYQDTCLSSGTGLAYVTARGSAGTLAYATKTFAPGDNVAFTGTEWVPAKTLLVKTTNIEDWVNEVRVDTPFDWGFSTDSATLTVPAQFSNYKMRVTASYDASQVSGYLVTSKETFDTHVTTNTTVDLGNFLLGYKSIGVSSKRISWASYLGDRPAGQLVQLRANSSAWYFVCSSGTREIVFPPLPEGTTSPIPVPANSTLLRVEGAQAPGFGSYDSFRENFLDRTAYDNLKTTWIERVINLGG